MADSKTVLVVGAGGNLGHLIAEALLARPEKLAVRASARDTSPASPQFARLDSLRQRGASVLEVDLVGGAGLDAACAGADVVISAVQGGPDVIIDGQSLLLDACVRAGVARLVPSDYSLDPFALDDGENMNSDWRRAFAAKVRASGIAALPWSKRSEPSAGPALIARSKQLPTIVAGLRTFDREDKAIPSCGGFLSGGRRR